MAEEDVKAKLKKLSPREREVLIMVCDGKPYKTIAKTLFIGVTTVKTHMGRIYVKLGLNYIEDRSMRIKAIFEIFKQALHEADLPVKVEEPIESEAKSESELEAESESEPEPEPEPESVPQNVQYMVSEDEKAITAYRRGDIITIYPIKREDPVKRRTINTLTLIVVIIVLALAVFGAFTIFQSLTKKNIPAEVIQPTQQQNNGISPTQIAVIPSNTEIVPSITPSSQPISIPKQAVLFEDNFDSGLSPQWETVSGEPMVVNGMLTAAQETWVVVGGSSWTNYSVEFDAESFYDYFQGKYNVTALRMNGTDNFFAYKWFRDEGTWNIIENGKWNEIPNSLIYNKTFSGMHNYRFTVNKSMITFYRDGMQIFSFVSNKFTSGKIGLMVGKETTIDNFKVKEILD